MSQSPYAGGGYYGSQGGGGYVQGSSPFGGSQASPSAQKVTIVGHVKSLRDQATNTVIVINDGSGELEARLWADAGQSPSDSYGGVHEGGIARVTGSLKVFGAKRYINAACVRPVEHNERVFHHFEVMYSTIRLERGAPPGTKAAEHAPAGAFASSTSGGASAYLAPSSKPAGSGGKKSLKEEITDYMKKHKSEDGVSVKDIAQALSSSNAKQISEALDQLLDEGNVYTTTDGSTFALVE
ncbi:hypothetical protein K525DRAFT_258525 [Schizophyllum commune Loenen D]|nr:hypothetical protein K525DRAFT_258525 [Schizophyllum commune Loenen D]